MFSSIVHISPTTSLVVGTNPPAHPQRHDAVLDLHAHEYTAVHTRGQHPFSPFHISLLCVFMCIVGTWNMLLSLLASLDPLPTLERRLGMRQPQYTTFSTQTQFTLLAQTAGFCAPFPQVDDPVTLVGFLCAPSRAHFVSAQS